MTEVEVRNIIAQHAELRNYVYEIFKRYLLVKGSFYESECLDINSIEFLNDRVIGSGEDSWSFSMPLDMLWDTEGKFYDLYQECSKKQEQERLNKIEKNKEATERKRTRERAFYEELKAKYEKPTKLE